MASDQSFADYIADQASEAGTITYRKMFGEYGLYCDGKIVALICDNRLFVKPTDAGRRFTGAITEAPAYPGAKPSLLIEDQIDNREWLGRLIRITHDALPAAKPKKKA